MSTEKLVDALGRPITRRRFLKSLGTGTLGAIAALLGWPMVASAHPGHTCPSDAPYHTKCCCTCKPGVSGLITSCTSSGTAGWCWTCYYSVDGRDYRCCEWKNTATWGCSRLCGGVTKSTYYRLGSAPEPA